MLESRQIKGSKIDWNMCSISIYLLSWRILKTDTSHFPFFFTKTVTRQTFSKKKLFHMCPQRNSKDGELQTNSNNQKLKIMFSRTFLTSEQQMINHGRDTLVKERIWKERIKNPPPSQTKDFKTKICYSRLFKQPDPFFILLFLFFFFSTDSFYSLLEKYNLKGKK